MFSTHLGTEVVAAALSNVGPRLFTSVTRDPERRKLFVKVVNATSDVQPLTIDLQAAGRILPQAKLISLSGKTPNVSNNIMHPDAVVPVKRNIVVAGTGFKEGFAPYSINVLELSY
jgi:alpha-N-arabinofuranosidase